jgi:hypothetical protein
MAEVQNGIGRGAEAEVQKQKGIRAETEGQR